MVQFVLVFGFFVLGFAFMIGCLYFSKFYGKGGCCGGGLEDFEGSNTADACFTCPNRGSEDCDEDEKHVLSSTPQTL